MAGDFTLDPRLQQDTEPVCDLPLCQLLLNRNASWPWLVVVPRVRGAAEITDLSGEDQQQLWQDVATTSCALQDITRAYKMNIATLGNIVRQLHVHVIARFEGDPAWPGPVWGSGHSKIYDPSSRAALLAQLQKRLSPAFAP